MTNFNEPWTVVKWDGEVYIASDSVRIAVFEDRHTEIYLQNAEANAHRIIACVNALEGIPTEDIPDMKKYLTGARSYGQLVHDMRQAQAERDELLRALELLVETTSPEFSERYGFAEQRKHAVHVILGLKSQRPEPQKPISENGTYAPSIPPTVRNPLTLKEITWTGKV